MKERHARQADFGFCLRVSEQILPAGGVNRVGPKRGAKPLQRRSQITVRAGSLGGGCRVRTVTREVKPMPRGLVVLKKIEGPAQLQHDLVVLRIGFVRKLEVLQRVGQIALVQASQTEGLGVFRGAAILGPRLQNRWGSRLHRRWLSLLKGHIPLELEVRRIELERLLKLGKKRVAGGQQIPSLFRDAWRASAPGGD